ncbi:MAG TPA: acyl-CoA dehydrogenase family protein, partial [Accumulibacter sp.]|nr:acyl-CoA dehydrogenase family protein [Accumulibacter sp.]
MSASASSFLSLTLADSYPEIREAIRDLCKHYPDAYWRKIDEQRGFPEEFVDALTAAGWLAAMIPEE